jgi:ClpP class serine protease
LKEDWAIDWHFANAYASLIVGLLNDHEIDVTEPRAEVFAITPTGQTVSNFDDTPKGSIAIVPLKGAMLKYDSLCEYGTKTLGAFLKAAADHKNISAAIIDIDSGGGAVNAVPEMVEAIKYAKSKMPVVAYVDVAASAAYYSAVFCDAIIASNNISSQIGSIGVMVSFIDAKPVWEKMGYKVHTIYAPESTHKNKPFELALEGKYDLIKKEMLSPLAIKFQQDVQTNRPDLNTKEEGILAGRVFFAGDALKHGMIDAIGNFDFALNYTDDLVRKQKQDSSLKYSSNSITMKKNLIATILGILAYDMLALQDGKVSLSKEDVNKIKAAYKDKFGRELDLKGVTFDAEEQALFSKHDILNIEQALNKPAPEGQQSDDSGQEETSEENVADRISTLEQQVETLVSQGSQNAQQVSQIMAEIQNLANQSDVIVIQNQNQTPGSTFQPGFVNGSGEVWDKADAMRPWNQRALGQPVVEGADTSVDLDRIIEDLGAYSRQRTSEIITFLRENNMVNQIFPFISGVNDEKVFQNLFLGQFTQAYQKGWTPKGTFKFEPEIVKMFRIKIDHEFEDLKSIELTWLSDLNKEGSSAYKMSFVGYLLREMLKKAAQEDSIAAINGVFKTPTDGVAGHYLDKMNGLRKYLRNKINERKIIPFQNLGEWNETNILDYERAIVEMIPEEWRDMPNLGFYASYRYMEARYARKKQLEGGNPTYDPNKSTIDNHENIRLIAIPYLGDSKRVFITPIGNIRQLEFVPNERQFLEIEKSKRVINAFCDYKRGIQALAVGKKWDVGETPDYEHQMIWCNDVDLPSTTFVKMVADDTTPSVLEHKSLVSVDNTQATAITNIDDAEVGDTVILKCGSDTNAITIAQAGNFANMSAAWNPSLGDTITLFLRAAGDWIDLARTTSSTDAIQIAADDTSPDVSGGNAFVTSGNTGATDITTLDNAEIGETYTIYGGSDTNSSTITNGGEMDLTADITLSLGTYIKLYCRAAGDFVEIERG